MPDKLDDVKAKIDRISTRLQRRQPSEKTRARVSVENPGAKKSGGAVLPKLDVARADTGRGAEQALESPIEERLFYELYDKVNIAYLLHREDVRKADPLEGRSALDLSYHAERLRMMSRYVRALVENKASEADLAKALCLWRGLLSSADVAAMMNTAERLKITFSTGGDLGPILNDKNTFSSSSHFAALSKDQVGDLRPEVLEMHRSHAQIRGQSRLFEVFDLVKNYIAPENWDERLRPAPADLLYRSAQELLEMRDEYGGQKAVTDRLFNRVAAVLLRIWKRSYQKVLNDAVVYELCEMILRQQNVLAICEFLRVLNQPTL